MGQRNESFRGKGTFYLKKKGDDTNGFLPVGNASSGDIAISESKIEQKDYEEMGGAVIDSIVSVDSVQLSIQVLNLNTANIARAIGGVAASVAITTSLAAAMTFTAINSYVPFEKLPDKTAAITLTDTGALVTYVEGVDYELRNGGIVILSSAMAGTTGEISYTSVDADKIQALTNIGDEYELIYDGINESKKASFMLRAHRVKIGLTQALALISEDFGSLPLVVDLLKDSSISGSGLSKYFELDKERVA